MLNERRQAASDVAEKLFALEAAIDQAIMRAGALSTAIPEARLRTKLSAIIGQDAIDRVGASLRSLSAARAEAIAAHHALAEVHQQIGLKTYAGGGLWKFAASTDSKPLALVAQNAA